jgi:predicted PurR-regulated permease PerM
MLTNTNERPEPRLLRRIAALVAVIVIAIVLAFCYFASSLCITLVLAAFLAILIDPIITRLERWNIPRPLSAALIVVFGMAIFGLLIYATYDKTTRFIDSFPQYAGRIREVTRPLLEKIERVQKSAGTLSQTQQPKRVPVVRIDGESSWTSYLVRGVGSVGGAVIVAGVVPFLIFFMLVRKEHIYSWLGNTFGSKIDVPGFITRLSQMVRGFVSGNLIVGVIMAIVTVGVLLAIKLEGAVALGIISALLNLIPFIGLVLGTLVLLIAAMVQFNTVGPFVIIVLTVTTLHLISSNLLIPRLIGSRVNIGPVAATVGMLFWGWLWGAIGVLLAVPLTAFIKILADSHPSLTPISNLLAETPRPVPKWVQSGQTTMARAIPFLRRRSEPKE